MAVGTAVLDFGSTPTHEGSVVVTGQSGIGSGSHVEPFLMRNAADEESDMAPFMLVLTVGAIVPGTGFTIFASSRALATGSITVHWAWTT